MPAHEKLSSMQFHYDTFDVGEPKPLHRVKAFSGQVQLGTMLWSGKEIRNIGVNADQQRRGVATGMYEHAQGLAAENQRIPAPRHSPDRTAAGDAWARKVGGRLPRRKEFRATIGEPRPA
jgi:hypothetical protein